MIAPVNCCSDCDCAQRMVRCQRAAPVSPAQRWFSVRLENSTHVIDTAVFSWSEPEARKEISDRWPFYKITRFDGIDETTPPYVIPASLGIAPVSCVEVTPDGTAEIPATDIFIEGDGKPTHIDVPTMTVDEFLAKLEEEFPATMGIAPFPEDAPGVTLREFTPEENAAFDAADAKMASLGEQKKTPLSDIPPEELLDAIKWVHKNCPELFMPSVTGLTFDDVERISKRAANYDRIATIIENDPEWIIDYSIDDAEIAAGLRLAAKTLREGKVTP